MTPLSHKWLGIVVAIGVPVLLIVAAVRWLGQWVGWW